MKGAHWRGLSAMAYDGRRNARAVSRISLAVGSDPRRLIDRDVRSMATYSGAWLVAVLISATINAVLAEADSRAWASYVLLYGGYWSIWALATPLIYAMIAGPRTAGAAARVMRFSAHVGLLALLVLASNLYFLAWNSAVAGVSSFDAATYWSRFSGGGALPFIGIHLLKYAIIALVCTNIWQKRTRQQQEQARIAAELETHSLAVQLADAKLANLREQLHPHLLFNALNCIASLIEIRRNADAYAAVSDLAQLLRRTLEMGRRETVALRDDVEHARSYLRIAELRFGNHLSWCIEVDPACESLAVPPLLLQPLVENAVKHAANQSDAPVRIGIDVRGGPGRAEIIVSDDGPGPGTAAAGTGIGLGNLRERLALMYGDAATLSVGAAAAGRGTTVRIIVPRADARVQTRAESGG
jgi:anti-sigma regulatory factor (Ser/Thr protein kinase)